MFFDCEAIPSRPRTGFHWLKPMPSFGPSVSRPRSPKRPCSTLHGAGLGSRPDSFEQLIPFPRQRTRDHGESLFFYSVARTTLLGSNANLSSTIWNRYAIGPIPNSRIAQKAGIYRRRDAYYGRSTARKSTSRPRAMRSQAPRNFPSSAGPPCRRPTSKSRRR